MNRISVGRGVMSPWHAIALSLSEMVSIVGPLIYDKDFGRAALLAVSHPAAAGRIFNIFLRVRNGSKPSGAAP